MSAIRQIVYMSTAEPKFTSSQLEQILHDARTNNAAKDITGLLIYGDGSIVQAIEGGPDEIERLFTLIRVDSRHKDVTRIVDHMVDCRDFPGWKMAYAHEPHAERIEQCVNLLHSKDELRDDMSSKGVVGAVLGSYIDRNASALM